MCMFADAVLTDDGGMGLWHAKYQHSHVLQQQGPVGAVYSSVLEQHISTAVCSSILEQVVCQDVTLVELWNCGIAFRHTSTSC